MNAVAKLHNSCKKKVLDNTHITFQTYNNHKQNRSENENYFNTAFSVIAEREIKLTTK